MLCAVLHLILQNSFMAPNTISHCSPSILCWWHFNVEMSIHKKDSNSECTTTSNVNWTYCSMHRYFTMPSSCFITFNIYGFRLPCVHFGFFCCFAFPGPLQGCFSKLLDNWTINATYRASRTPISKENFPSDHRAFRSQDYKLLKLRPIRRSTSFSPRNMTHHNRTST